MSSREDREDVIEAFSEAMHRAVDNYAFGGDLSYAEVVGVIELVKADVIIRMKEDQDG